MGPRSRDRGYAQGELRTGQAVRRRRELRAELQRAMAGLDIVLTAAAPNEAPKIGSRTSTYFPVATLPRSTTWHLGPILSAIFPASRSSGSRYRGRASSG